MRYKGVWCDTPSYDAAYGIFSFIVIVVQRGNQYLQRSLDIHQWSRNGIHNCLEQWLETHALVIWMIHSHPITPNSIEDREIEVSIGSSQFKEEILGPFMNLLDACVAPIYFIDDNDRL